MQPAPHTLNTARASASSLTSVASVPACFLGLDILIGLELLGRGGGPPF